MAIYLSETKTKIQHATRHLDETQFTRLQTACALDRARKEILQALDEAYQRHGLEPPTDPC